ncbi:helix-turn-helix domain-containing protein [Paenibacillus cymbidii]|uniref:helix-turn-helix domain-containing protein n=1 Tax=Paenibacillus cymbidii TaxID=1639034 RepID=UPI001436BC03|nr:helix-turn-helix domain-containing protein [Paenibacillus cymbidii]
MGYFKRVNINYLRRMTITYSIFAAVLIGMAGTYFYTKANESMTNEIGMSSKYRLDKVRDFTEESLKKKYEQTYADKVLSTVDPKGQPSDFLYFLSNPWEGNSYRIIQLVEDLYKTRRGNIELQDVTVYYTKEQFLVNSQTFHAQPARFEDQTFIEQLASVKHHEWFKRTSSAKEDLLTYVYTLPYMSTGDKISGYLYIDLNIDSLKKEYASMMNSSSEKLYVFDHSGNLLFGTLPPGEQDMAEIAALKSEGLDFKLINSPEGKVVVSYLPAGRSADSWSYATVLPLGSVTLYAAKLKSQILWACLIVLLLGFVLSYVLSRRFYLPLKNVLVHIRNIYETAEPASQTNEYSRIDHFIHHLDQRIVSLEDELVKKDWIRLLYGHSGGTALEERMHLYGNRSFIVALIKTEPTHAASAMEKFEMANHLHPYELIPLHPDEFAVLYIVQADETDDGQSIRGDMEKFQLLIRREFAIGIGIGSFAASLKDIHLSYRHAKLAGSYSFLYGASYLLSYREVSARSRLAPPFPFEPFENALKAGEAAEAEALIDQYEQRIQAEPVHLETIELTLHHIVGVLSKVTIDLNLQDNIKSTSDLFAEYRQASFAATVAWIKAIARDISRYIGLHTKDVHQALVQELKLFIDQNLHEDISLDTLAGRASLSASYISTLFREVTNTPFSEYITQARLQKASDLLINDAISVKQIAADVGYRNVAYFCTKFKEKFGVTPVQFRNANQYRRLESR